MNKFLHIIIIIVFGIFTGNFWASQQYNNILTELNQQINDNKALLSTLNHKIISMKNEIEIWNKVDKIIECESNYNPLAIGDGGKAQGLAQFHKKTFDYLVMKSGLKRLKYKDPYSQIRLLQWAIKNGYGNWWTCHQKLYKNALKR